MATPLLRDFPYEFARGDHHGQFLSVVEKAADDFNIDSAVTSPL
jgi:hypothetical protein